MPSRLINPLPQFRTALGELAAFGTLNFFITGTSTPKNVFSAPDLITNLGSSLVLNSAGQTPTSPWLNGDYSVQLLDALGAQVWLLANVQDLKAATAYALPNPTSGTNGQVVITNGTAYVLSTLEALPDPTGFPDGYLATDGTLWFPATFPAASVYSQTNLPGGIVQGTNSVQIGKMLYQYGTGTIPTSGTVTANVAIVFATAYVTLKHVDITMTGSGGSTPQGAKPVISYVGSATGFTAYAYAGDEHDSPGWTLTGTTSFTYEAVGLVA